MAGWTLVRSKLLGKEWFEVKGDPLPVTGSISVPTTASTPQAVRVTDGTAFFKPTTPTDVQPVTASHGRYLKAVLENRAYFLSATNAAPVAYVGAAAGTPLLAIHNPTGSNKLVAVLIVGWAARVGASAAGNTGLAAWSGVSAAPTGTTTTPVNVYSQTSAGSAATGFVNTALTTSTALTLALPLLEYQMIGATPVSQAISPGLLDTAGILAAAPGNQIALGMTTVPPSLTCDIAIYWEEVPLT